MKRFVISLMSIYAMASSTPSCADTFVNQRVNSFFMDTRPCVFFKLSGVVGNPAVPSDWFALSTTHPNFQQLHAYLLSARLSNIPVNVTTDTAGACGWTNVVSVQLP
jgi:hypothetical protein